MAELEVAVLVLDVAVALPLEAAAMEPTGSPLLVPAVSPLPLAPTGESGSAVANANVKMEMIGSRKLRSCIVRDDWQLLLEWFYLMLKGS